MKQAGCLRYIVSIIFLSLSLNGFANSAPDLMNVFQRSSEYDPTYQQAVATYNAAKEALPQSIAGVLPSLDLSAAITKVIQTNRSNGSSNLTQNNYGLNATQTIFNFGVFEQIAQAKHSVQSAAYILSAAGQDLMVRTARAYFAVLQAEELLNYTKQQRDFIYQQYQATQKRYDHREATITDLNQAKGAYELMAVQLTQAQESVYTSYQNLEQITAKNYDGLAKLKNNFPLVTPRPNKLIAWVNKAKEANLNLLSAKENMLAQHENVNVQKGNYLPNITANGSYTRGRELLTSDTSNALITGHYHELQGGLNLQWNVYQGGLTNSQVRAAAANYQQAYAQRDQAYLNAITNTRISYDNVTQGINEIKMAKLAMQSSTIALIKAEKAYRAGLLTVTDILQIQNILFQAQKEYVNDVYSYLVDVLLLQQAAGTLSVRSMMVENQWLM